MLTLWICLHGKQHHHHHQPYGHSAPNINIQDCPCTHCLTHPIQRQCNTNRDTITKTILDALDTTIPGGTFWACCIIVFDPVEYDKLVCLSTNDGLGKISTQLILLDLSAGHSWGTFPLNQVLNIGYDKEDEAQVAIEALAARLTKILTLT